MLDDAVEEPGCSPRLGSGRHAGAGSRRSAASRPARVPSGLPTAGQTRPTRPRRRTSRQSRPRTPLCGRRPCGPDDRGSPPTAARLSGVRQGPARSRRDRPPRRHEHGSSPRPAPWSGRLCRSSRCPATPRTGRGSPPPGRSGRCRWPPGRPGGRGRCGRPGSRRGCGDGGSPPDAPAWSASRCSRRCRLRAGQRPRSPGLCPRWRSDPSPAPPIPRPTRPRPPCRRRRSAPAAVHPSQPVSTGRRRSPPSGRRPRWGSGPPGPRRRPEPPSWPRRCPCRPTRWHRHGPSSFPAGR